MLDIVVFYCTSKIKNCKMKIIVFARDTHSHQKNGRKELIKSLLGPLAAKAEA
jgi:hypothetical protein